MEPVHVYTCPTCKKALGERLAQNLGLAPVPVKHLGPNRLAAVETSQNGFCAICDELPIPSRAKGRGRGARYTCGKAECKRLWTNLASMDWHAAKRAREAA